MQRTSTRVIRLIHAYTTIPYMRTCFIRGYKTLSSAVVCRVETQPSTVLDRPPPRHQAMTNEYNERMNDILRDHTEAILDTNTPMQILPRAAHAVKRSGNACCTSALFSAGSPKLGPRFYRAPRSGRNLDLLHKLDRGKFRR
jgi:hypothetical protein